MVTSAFRPKLRRCKAIFAPFARQQSILRLQRYTYLLKLILFVPSIITPFKEWERNKYYICGQIHVNPLVAI